MAVADSVFGPYGLLGTERKKFSKRYFESQCFASELGETKARNRGASAVGGKERKSDILLIIITRC